MEHINQKKVYKLLGIVVISIMAIIMFKYSSTQSFWLDELDWTVDYLDKSHNYYDLIYSLIKAGFNLPLFYVVMFPIYKIVPYGEVWLLIPNFIATILGVYFTYKVANRLNEHLGIASLCMSATSFVLFENCAFNFRPYAFLFCLSSYALLKLICKFQEPQKQTSTILYTISIVLLAFTHWFGCLIIAFYFFVDFVLWIRKKNKISFVLPYFILGIVFIPYFIFIIFQHTTSFSNYWPRVPTTNDLIFGVFNFLLSNNILCILSFILGIVLLLYIFSKNENTKFNFNVVFVLLGSIIWTLGTIYVYSKYINPKGSLWVLHYFIVILPHIFVICSIPIAKLLSYSAHTSVNNLEAHKYKNTVIFSIVILTTVLIACINYTQLHISQNSLNEPYREISSILSNISNVYEENSAVFISSGKGFLTYYFQKKGVEIPCNVYEAYTESSMTHLSMSQCVNNGLVVNSTPASLEDLLQYDYLYVCLVHKGFDSSILNFIYNNYNVTTIDKDVYVYLCTKKEKPPA